MEEGPPVGHRDLDDRFPDGQRLLGPDQILEGEILREGVLPAQDQDEGLGEPLEPHGAHRHAPLVPLGGEDVGDLPAGIEGIDPRLQDPRGPSRRIGDIPVQPSLVQAAAPQQHPEMGPFHSPIRGRAAGDPFEPDDAPRVGIRREVRVHLPHPREIVLGDRRSRRRRTQEKDSKKDSEDGPRRQKFSRQELHHRTHSTHSFLIPMPPH